MHVLAVHQSIWSAHWVVFLATSILFCISLTVWNKIINYHSLLFPPLSLFLYWYLYKFVSFKRYIHPSLLIYRKAYSRMFGRIVEQLCSPEISRNSKSCLIALSTDIYLLTDLRRDVTEQAISRLVVVHGHERPVIVCSRWVTSWFPQWFVSYNRHIICKIHWRNT